MKIGEIYIWKTDIGQAPFIQETRRILYISTTYCLMLINNKYAAQRDISWVQQMFKLKDI